MVQRAGGACRSCHGGATGDQAVDQSAVLRLIVTYTVRGRARSDGVVGGLIGIEGGVVLARLVEKPSQCKTEAGAVFRR